jgi:hypothetical protein
VPLDSLGGGWPCGRSRASKDTRGVASVPRAPRDTGRARLVGLCAPSHRYPLWRGAHFRARLHAAWDLGGGSDGTKSGSEDVDVALDIDGQSRVYGVCGVCPRPSRAPTLLAPGGAPQRKRAPQTPPKAAHPATDATAPGDVSLPAASLCTLFSTTLLASHGSGRIMLEGLTPLFSRTHQINHAL